MSRDLRPYFDNDFGIPWDEAQFACALADGERIRMMRDIDEQAAKFARLASQRLRNHPSHKVRK